MTSCFVYRAIHGVEIFGGQERVTMCVDQVMPQSVMNLIGFSKCSKLIAEEMAAEQARQDALLASGNYTYAPPAPGVGEGAEVEVSLFGYFLVYLVYLVIFGYFWLFLAIFGNFRMGNCTDDVFCSTLTDCYNARLTSRGLGSKGTRSCTAPRWPPAS